MLVSLQHLFIGKVTGIEINHKTVEMAKKGQDVAIRIELPQYETPKMVGRHFEPTDDIVSMVRADFLSFLSFSFVFFFFFFLTFHSLLLFVFSLFPCS